MKGLLGRKYFGMPAWVILVIGGILIYYLYARGGSKGSQDQAGDANAPGGQGTPIGAPTFVNVNRWKRKKKKKK